jgi:aspartyl-tRNA(Asn)/glutamyl-tRNA(Gln) amidotransferase subunit A
VTSPVPSLLEASRLLRAGELSPVELTTACLARIEELNPVLNAFVTVTADSALEQARAAEAEMQQNRRRGPLHGIPVALKDLFDVAGVPTTAASRVFRDRVPQQDAEVVGRLKAAGAVLLGKTNLHEFAFGGSSVVSAYGPVRNPLAPERIAGGSSSGSAVAVASGMCCAALGTDTAGSVRLPAAYCGVVGLKPTYGLVSTRGVVPLAWSFDHVGPIARSAAEAARVLAVIAGFDPEDINSRPIALRETTECELPRLRLGIARDYFFDGLDAEISACVEQALGCLERLMASSREVQVPMDTDRTVHNAEVWAYHQKLVERAPELYDPDTLQRIRRGAEIPAADYIRAWQQVQKLRRRAADLFAEVEVIATPTVPVLPPAIAELAGNLGELRARELMMLRNTRPFNVLGVPAVTVPCGATASGLPIGLQLAAAPGADLMLLAMAEQLAGSIEP